MQKQYENIVWEKSNEAYPLLIRVQTTKPQFDLFLPCMNVKENVFFSSEREFKKALRDTLMRAAWYELLLYLLVSTRAVIGQFSGPYSPVRPAKI